MKNLKGFTIIELMIVIALTGIAMSILIPFAVEKSCNYSAGIMLPHESRGTWVDYGGHPRWEPEMYCALPSPGTSTMREEIKKEIENDREYGWSD